MSEPLTVGAPPPPSDAGQRVGNPWDRRRELGFLSALVEAIQGFVLRPSQTFDDTRERGDYGGPLLFAVILGWISALISQLWSLLFRSSLTPLLPLEMRDEFAPFLVGSGVSFAFQVLIAPLYIVVGVFISAGILHLCLMLVSGLDQSRAGFEGTFRVVCFATVANLAQIIPLAGSILALIWWLILGSIGLSSLHRTTQGRALIAILIPLVLCCVCVVLGGVVFGVSIAALAAAIAGSG